tara:strand:+ start:160 stop:711 length:552 start_codon:yes stop_codon:yes gene_type:complete
MARSILPVALLDPFDQETVDVLKHHRIRRYDPIERCLRQLDHVTFSDRVDIGSCRAVCQDRNLSNAPPSANTFWPETAVFGYLVSGLGDAIAEPIGLRFGRHRYRVLPFTGIRVKRSYEGSASVFAVSLISLGLLGFADPTAYLTPIDLLTLAALSSAVEALSPHSWDNATMLLCHPMWDRYY